MMVGGAGLFFLMFIFLLVNIYKGACCGELIPIRLMREDEVCVDMFLATVLLAQVTCQRKKLYVFAKMLPSFPPTLHFHSK